MNFISIITCHAATAFSFLLFTLMLPNLHGNVFLNGFMIGIFEILAFTGSSYLIAKLGLRNSIFLCFLISLISSLLYLGKFNTDFSNATFLAILMFGIAANSNATLFAGYICTPPILTAKFFVI